MTEKTDKIEIIVTGFGGQGIVLAGSILGKAAALGDKKESTLVQSYGPESRGGSCSAQVVISDSTIHYPYIRRPDVLVCMSLSGYEKYIGQIKQSSTLIIDKDLVKPQKIDRDYFAIPATRLAEELGRKMMANIIMVGFFTAVTKIISLDAAKDTVAKSVPKGTEKQNIAAFTKGFDYGLAKLKGREKRALGQPGAIS
ncbi:MAG: 2-oxoacid:acceptor oxidoreductase family protein [Deltaproteobacteria bacterium]|nr:2-oxoacid:acceptor oxidoreductase family protein [Deltaproteobacteria bacterium]